MRIRFETTPEDLIAFQLFHFGNKAGWRLRVWVQALIFPLILAGMFGLIVATIWVVDPEPFETWPYVLAILVLFLVVSLAWIVIMQWDARRSLAIKTRQLLKKRPENRTANDWYEIELADGRLVVDARFAHYVCDLRAIDRIVGNENYTYLYISASSAFIIPTDPQHPERREFVAEIEDAWERRESFPSLQRNVVQSAIDDRIVEGDSGP